MKKIVVAMIAESLFVLGLASFSYASTGSSLKPEVKMYRGIPYLSGGFGTDERAALRSVAHKYNVEMSFALENKDFLGGAHVVIKDQKGSKVLETDSDGPLFYTQLPQGKYVVRATARERTLEQQIEVPAHGPRRVYFVWKERDHEVRQALKAKGKVHARTMG